MSTSPYEGPQFYQQKLELNYSVRQNIALAVMGLKGIRDMELNAPGCDSDEVRVLNRIIDELGGLKAEMEDLQEGLREMIDMGTKG